MPEGNPYVNKSYFDAPLSLDMVQEIDFSALSRVVESKTSEPLPEHIAIEQLRQLRHKYGTEIFIREPSVLAEIYHGITLDIYRAIETVYCSRELRSPRITWRILTAMAQAARAETLPSFEAVWAICLYLYRRRMGIEVGFIQQLKTPWFAGKVELDIHLRVNQNYSEHLSLVYIIERDATRRERILAYRFVDEADAETALRAALYDAICVLRKPQADPEPGLLWSIPHTLFVETSDADVSGACTNLGIATAHYQNQPALAQILSGDWLDGIRHDGLSPARFGGILDTYLHKKHGFSPHREQDKQKRAYAHSKTYASDPADIFPNLRLLLRKEINTIVSPGEVICADLHFVHPYLAYFCGETVTVRMSYANASVAWIYLDGAVLCKAYARELQRADGTYRKMKAGRQ